MKALRAPALAVICLAFFGCAFPANRPPPPLVTKLGSSPVELPGRMFGNILVVEAKWDRNGPYHFLIDTGSSLTLITPELAQRYGAEQPVNLPHPTVRVRSSDGTTTVLPSVLLDRLELGKARFGNVPALIYDCSSLTAQLGLKVDGVLGYSLFRQCLLTLDYPRHRVLLQAVATAPPPAGAVVPFASAEKTPAIDVRLGGQSMAVLIDSGSNDTMTLNPVATAPVFAFGPVDGPTVGTLTGDRVERIGRLADTLYVGDYAIPRPLAVIGDLPPTLGGGILKFFTVSFDQEHNRAVFSRDSADPIAIPGIRTAGMSFSKTPVYWRVVGVIRGSPADRARVQNGDLVARVNGEAVQKWDSWRYEQLLANASEVAFTFVVGTQEKTLSLAVVDLIP